MSLTPKNFKHHFEVQAKKYSHFADKNYSWHYIEKPALSAALKTSKRDSTIIDISCGHGRTTGFLIDEGFLVKNITATDISEKAIDLAKKELPEVEFIIEDFAEEISKQKTYDIALANMVLNSFSDKSFNKFVSNVYEILNKGGLLIYQAAHPKRVEASPNYRADQEWFYENTPWGEKVPVFPRSEESQINCLKMAGFTRITASEARITPGGQADEVEYKNYSRSPARIIVTAIK